ncbi:MAG: protoporphyrinogen oxidase, partial [Bacteroidota bacterium]
MTPLPRVLVIGGGISGLSAAFWLKRAGFPVEVLEEDPEAGGTMKTVVDNGWLVEMGPNSALETTPLFELMFKELGILSERLYADAASENRYIVRDGRLHALPMKPGAFLKSGLWTFAGKLRLLKEPFVGRARDEESVASFVERRLGREFLDYAINPFVAGVYAGDPAQLSVRAAFPKLYALEREYGGLIRGMIGGARKRKRRAEKAKDRATMFSFARGMQTFPRALSRYIGPEVQGGNAVRALSPYGAGDKTRSFRVTVGSGSTMREHQSDLIIIATPARAAANLIESFAPAVAARLRSIYYPPVAEVFLGYRTPAIKQPLNGFGYLVPAKEHRSVLGTIWSSSLFPYRSPEGHVALTSFVGGSRQPELTDRSDEELVALTHNEIRSLLGAEEQPVYQRVMRWRQAIPQYNLGHGSIMDAVGSLEAGHPGLFFCANYRGGIAVGDCVMNAERLAARVAKHL